MKRLKQVEIRKFTIASVMKSTIYLLMIPIVIFVLIGLFILVST
ncbi:hypothetical protein [Shouchella shacheensis]|nr:hypothetical protein [Shouchella shacheensis]